MFFVVKFGGGGVFVVGTLTSAASRTASIKVQKKKTEFEGAKGFFFSGKGARRIFGGKGHLKENFGTFFSPW